MVVAVADAFGEMIMGGFTSGIAVGVSELVAARFSRWRHFFAAFLEILVSMVTEMVIGMREMTEDGD
jgi:hypothetical protein